MQTDQAVAPQFKRDLNTDIYPYTSRDMSPEDGYVTVRCNGRGVELARRCGAIYVCSEFTVSYARALAAELIAAADAATGGAA